MNIPDHAFNFLNIPRKDVKAVDLLSGNDVEVRFGSTTSVDVDVDAYKCVILKTKLSMDTEEIFNAHNKEEFPPAHTAEHLLNQRLECSDANARAMLTSNARKAR